MAVSFDPYYELLGIPPKDQPPHHYRLLGLDLYEQNQDVIQRAADRQTVHVRSYQSGPHGVHTQRLLTDISVARLCLLDPSKKSAYDAELRRRLAPAPPVAPPPPPRSARVAGSGIQQGGVGLVGSGSNSDVLSSPEPGNGGPGSSSSGPVGKSGPKAATSGGGTPLPSAPAEPPPMSPWMLGIAVGGGLCVGVLALITVLSLQPKDPPPIAKKPPVVEPADPKTTDPKATDPGKRPPKVAPMPKPKKVDDPLPMVVIPPTPMPEPMPVDPLPTFPTTPQTPVGQDSGQIPGLVFYAPFDEGLGANAYDQMKKVKGVFKGTSAPQWVEGKFGKGLSFDTRCHVEFGNVNDFEADKPFSWGAWVWIEPAAADGTIGGKMAIGGKRQRGYDLFVSPGGVETTLNTNNTTELSVGQQGVPRGQWVHLMATYAGTRTANDLTLYLGGRSIGARSGTTLPGSLDSNAPFCIGGRNGAFGFLGKIDEFRVYNRQLSDEEVAYLAANDPATLSAPATARRVAVDLDADGSPSDLLPLVDVKLDQMQGEWTAGAKSAVVSPADGLLQLPVAPPLRYRLTILGTRTSQAGELTVGLPIGSSAAAATFFGAVPVSVADLDKPTASTNDKITALGDFVIICDCSPEGIKIKVNGEEAIDWEGRPDQAALPGKWQPKSPRQLFLGSTGGTFQISRVQLAKPSREPGERLAQLPPPPSDEELRDATMTVKADYQKAIRTAKTPEARAAVAEEFLVKGRGAAEPAMQYALATQARDVASSLGAAELAFDAIDFLSQKFRIDAWDQRAKVMTEAMRMPQTPVGRQLQLARKASELASLAAKGDQFTASNKLLDLAEGVATKVKDNDTRLALQQQRAENELLVKVAQEADKARQTIARAPTDGAARMALGRYYCLVQGDWQRGAKEYKQCGDAKLAAIAAIELAAVDAETRRTAGEAWWRQAQTGGDPCKVMVERHALDLLADSLGGLPSAAQKEVNRFIAQMFVQTPATAPKPTRRGLKVWLKADEGVQQQGGQVHTWNDMSGNGNAARQDKPQFAMKVVPNVLGGRPVLRADEGSGQCFSLPLSDIQNYEGFTLLAVANTGAVARNEAVLAAPGPDVHWFFGRWGNHLGYITDGNGSLGNTKRLIKIDEPFLVSYRCTKKQGWQVDFDGEDVGYVGEKSFPVTPHTLLIGNNQLNTTGANPFGGDIAEILIYDHALSQAEFRQASMYLTLKYQLNFPMPEVKRERP